MRRWLTIVVVGLLLLPLLGGGLVAVVLGTETGAGWLLGAARERLPGMEYTHFEGNLAGGVTLHGPRYAQDGLEVKAERLHLAVAPELFPLVIRLRVVEADGLQVRLPPAADSESAPLPESLALPLKIQLDQLHVDGLRVVDAAGAPLFEAVGISANGEFYEQARFSLADLELP